MKRRAGGESGEVVLMPEHLRAHICVQMVAHFEPHEPVPSYWFREPTWYYGNREQQDARWRECRALRRALDEKRAWLAEHGYVRPSGHVDWQRFDAEQATLGGLTHAGCTHIDRDGG